jgi:serine protease Do
VVQNADNIIVRLLDDKEYKAEIKGVDPRTDLAVLKIDASNLPSLKLGDSDKLRVGEWVLAIGSPLQAEFAHTVTAGIVSAKGRRLRGIESFIQDFIQTDAAINPGNSGGALVNLKGELVGINTAIASRSGGSIGIGFAIPTNLAGKVMTDILEKGKVVRGWLGVTISDVPEEVVKMYELETKDGAFVREVENEGPADKAGVEAGDIILEVSGKKIRNSTELITLIGSSEPGNTVNLKILRDGKGKNIEVRLEEFPEEESLIARSQRNSLESLGIEVETVSRNLRKKYNVTGNDEGVVITSIQQGSVADRLGLQEGDMIIRINRRYVSNVSEFSRVVGELGSGDPVVLYIRRGDRKFVRDFVMP